MPLNTPYLPHMINPKKDNYINQTLPHCRSFFNKKKRDSFFLYNLVLRHDNLLDGKYLVGGWNDL